MPMTGANADRKWQIEAPSYEVRSASSTAGSTSIGRSKNAIDASTIATTNSLPLRIVDFVDGPSSSVGDSFTDVIVTYLPLSHAYETALGV